MKKKLYIEPTIMVVNIRPNNLLAGSAEGTDVYDNASTEYETLGRESDFSDF